METKGWDVNQIFESNLQNTVTVATDSVTNSKALKFYIANTSGAATYANIPLNISVADLSQSSTGKILVSYDYRVDNHSRNVDSLGGISGTKDNIGGNAFSMHGYGADIYCAGSNNATTNYIGGMIKQNKESYTHVDFVYDTVTGIGTVYKDGTVVAKDKQGEIKDVISAVKFSFTYKSGNLTGYNGSDTNADDANNAGVYWVDNVQVERIEKRTENNEIFADDFESYNEGNSVPVLQAKGWNTQRQSVDSITVETDPDTKNKALKFTIANNTGSETWAKAMFPTGTKGKVKLSYDFKAQNHSRNIRNAGGMAGYNMIACGSTVYVTAVKNAVFDVKSNAQANGYTHIDIVYDSTTGKGSIYVNGKIVQQGVDGGIKDSIEYVGFSFNKGVSNFADWNGSDNDGTDTNAGVYWIDNLSLTQLDDNYFADDFESYSENSTLDSVYCWDTNADGNSIVVATDPKTQSKALKFTMANDSTSAFHANAVLPTVVTGKINVSFDFRAQNDTKKFSSLGKIVGTGGDFGMHTASGNFWYFKSASLAPDYFLGTLDLTDRNYTHFDIIYDTTAKSGDIYIDGKYKNTYEGTVTDVKNIAFEFGYNAYHTGGDSTGDAVYWVDNLVVKKASLGVISTTPENDAKLASPSEISVKFNGPVSYNSETDADKIKIYGDDTQITSGYTVSVDSNDSNVLNIAFDGKLNGKKTYKITVGKLSSTDPGFADMENEYTFQFKTLGKDVEVKYLYNNSDIEKISDVQGQTVTVRVTVDTEKIKDDYTAFVALKNEKGQLKAIDMKDKPETGDYVELSLLIDSDAADDWDIECFVWEKDTLKPLTASVESFKKK